jgi:hypothetical protein
MRVAEERAIRTAFQAVSNNGVQYFQLEIEVGLGTINLWSGEFVKKKIRMP